MFSELEKNIQEKIKNKLSKKLKKYKIQKIQIQYKGLKDEVQKALLQLPRNEIKASIFYEIVLKAKKEKGYALYEVLLDEKGEIIKELKFKPANSDNLEF